MKTATKQVLKGFIISNVFAFALIGLSKVYIGRPISDSAGTMVLSEFVIIPVVMGIICAWYWRNLRLHVGIYGLYSLYNSFISIALSYILLREGTICLLIVSPLIICFMWLGAAVGRSMFKADSNDLNVSVFALLFLVFIWDSTSTHYYKNEVSDTITINAPPAKVWPNVVAFKKIKQNPDFWLFKIGLPSPMETTVDGYYKGAGRKCIFSNGYTFGEKISTYEPGHDLVFDITDQPRDPEIMNHLDLLRGEFLLKDNGNGTTTLTGNSWYKLYVFPTWYYDIWAQSIVRNVHTLVMAHIKELSENDIDK
jgi:uncharacterized protein YndB with AHSA1/START domain